MSINPPTHRLPRAGVDRIDSHRAAMSVISMAIHQPLRHETIVLLLDHHHRGVAVAVVTGTEADDDVLDTVERLLTAADLDQVGAVVVASVRPGRAGSSVGEAEIDRWLELSDIVDEAGPELLEWYVITDTVTCPRDLLGEPPRWWRADARWG